VNVATRPAPVKAASGPPPPLVRLPDGRWYPDRQAGVRVDRPLAPRGRGPGCRPWCAFGGQCNRLRAGRGGR